MRNPKSPRALIGALTVLVFSVVALAGGKWFATPSMTNSELLGMCEEIPRQGRENFKAYRERINAGRLRKIEIVREAAAKYLKSQKDIEGLVETEWKIDPNDPPEDPWAGNPRYPTWQWDFSLCNGHVAQIIVSLVPDQKACKISFSRDQMAKAVQEKKPLPDGDYFVINWSLGRAVPKDATETLLIKSMRGVFGCGGPEPEQVRQELLRRFGCLHEWEHSSFTSIDSDKTSDPKEKDKIMARQVRHDLEDLLGRLRERCADHYDPRLDAWASTSSGKKR